LTSSSSSLNVLYTSFFSGRVISTFVMTFLPLLISLLSTLILYHNQSKALCSSFL
jgi:hypothetical protein